MTPSFIILNMHYFTVLVTFDSVACFIPFYTNQINTLGLDNAKFIQFATAIMSGRLDDALIGSVAVSIPYLIEYMIDNTMTSRAGNIFRFFRVVGFFLPNLATLCLLRSIDEHGDFSLTRFIPSIFGLQIIFYAHALFSSLYFIPALYHRM